MQEMALKKLGRTVDRVGITLVIVVAYMGCGFHAGDYVHHTPGMTGSDFNFWLNSIKQLPNASGVVAYSLDRRLWGVLPILGLEVGADVFWMRSSGSSTEDSGVRSSSRLRSVAGP